MEYADDLVRSALASTSQGLEVEFRLGRAFGTTFVPGVSQACFEKLAAVLNNSPSFVPLDIETRETLLDNQKYVETVSIKSRGTPQAPPPPRWNAKTRVGVVDFGSVGTGALVCRLSVAHETWGTGPAPDAAHHSYTRHKKRRSYRHKEWVIDMTVVSGNVPGMADEPGDIYEVEVELISPDSFLRKPRPIVVQAGMKIVTDIVDIMEKNN